MKSKIYFVPLLSMILLIIAAMVTKSSNIQFDLRSKAVFAPTPQTQLPISLDKTLITVSLSRSEAQSGLVYGPGFTITSQGANGFQIKNNQPTQGQGFYESSGGMTNGSKQVVRSYISTSKPNGTYTGTAIVRYSLGNTWYDGPTVSYKITLYTPIPSPIQIPQLKDCLPCLRVICLDTMVCNCGKCVPITNTQ